MIFEDGTDSIKSGLHKAVDRALYKSTLHLQGEIKGESPVLSGHLRGSVDMGIEPSRLEGEVSTNLEYAMRIEYGFKGEDILGRNFNQKPNPFFRRGAKNAEPGIGKIFEQELRRPINIAYKKAGL